MGAIIFARVVPCRPSCQLLSLRTPPASIAANASRARTKSVSPCPAWRWRRGDPNPLPPERDSKTHYTGSWCRSKLQIQLLSSATPRVQDGPVADVTCHATQGQPERFASGVSDLVRLVLGWVCLREMLDASLPAHSRPIHSARGPTVPDQTEDRSVVRRRRSAFFGSQQICDDRVPRHKTPPPAAPGRRR